ncbi:uncharacterized protein LOC114452047 [Parambassis ranga]|uniref:Uncharacterized protein LOC114452047 n=1 Tax=Parambassis ranga TaxID=210632 RepID=A0A6P7KHS1_9TELE|nr:uncharacterized protein LOC114452047 [Parambassis ranga]
MSSSYNLRATTTGSRQPCSGLRKPQMSGIPTGIQRAAPGLKLPSGRTNVASSSSTEKLCGPTVPNPVIKPSQASKHTLSRGDNLPVSKRKKMDLPVSSDSVEAPTSDTTKGTRNLKQPAASRKAVPAKTQRDDAAVAKSTLETSTSCDAAKGARALKPPSSQRALPGKQQAHEAAGPANTVESSTLCDAASRARPLKMPATTCQGALQAKHGCAKCVELEEDLKTKSEEIRRLKKELLKYRTQAEEC